MGHQIPQGCFFGSTNYASYIPDFKMVKIYSISCGFAIFNSSSIRMTLIKINIFKKLIKKQVLPTNIPMFDIGGVPRPNFPVSKGGAEILLFLISKFLIVPPFKYLMNPLFDSAVILIPLM